MIFGKYIFSNPNCLRQLSADAIAPSTDVSSPSSSHTSSVTKNDSSLSMHGTQSPSVTNGQASQQQQQKSMGNLTSELNSLDLVNSS